MLDRLADYLYLIPVILVSLTVHEASHAYISSRLGDPTPGNQGRLTLNPIRHLDPLGTLMFFIARVGWAKPVPINPYYYKDRKMGILVTSAAGPLSNLVLAFVASFVFYLIQGAAVLQKTAPGTGVNTMAAVSMTFFGLLASVNIGLAAFNLIPIPPLDGSRILASVLPENYAYRLMQAEQYTGIIFIMIMFLKPGLFSQLLNPVIWFFRTAIESASGFLAGLLI